MSKRTSGWCVALLAALSCSLLAPAALAAPKEPPSFGRAVQSAQAVGAWISPRTDVQAILAEDEANAQRFDIPLRIGLPMAVDLEPGKNGTWEDLDHGDQIWRLRLESQGALWMVAGFDSFRLQDGGLLWIYDTDRRTVLGPFGAADVLDHGELWTVPIEGGEIMVELYWPARLRGEAPRLHLGTVSHGYKPFGAVGASDERAMLGSSGACNIDVACPLGDDWQDQQRGVVILLSGGSGFCTGSMINNVANDCKPYILTANHCSPGASTAYGFNYQRSGCGSGDPGAPTTQMVSGGTLRANFASSDFSLMEMSALPPQSFNFYLNGWSADPNPSTSSWVIHHPSGDFKKISLDSDPPVNGSNWGPNHWRIDDSSSDPAHRGYELGTTEPGSSGSPLFDQDHRITGQLHGGTASCSLDTYDEYGKVAASWAGGGTTASRLSSWLDPGTTGALVWDGKNGDSCFFQPAGSVALTRSRFACADTLTIRVFDDSLQNAGTTSVTVASTTESTPESVVLTESPAGSGDFSGTLPIATVAPVNGDGTLSVANGDQIAVLYIDADDGAGGNNVPRTTTATVDCAPPVITNVQASNVGGNSARITWTTDEPADSRVRFGTTAPPGSNTYAGALVTSHQVDLIGLSPCTPYLFSVESADAVANGASDTNGGTYFSFSTVQNTNPSYPSSGSPIPIPDNNATGITSVVAVADNKPVQDVDVTVNITHPYVGDLIVSLIPPTGPAITLINRRGGSGDNFFGTILDDEATSPISSITPTSGPNTGRFTPDGPLAGADGISSQGNWTLKVVDAAGQDLGTLDSWTLTLTIPGAPCGPHAQTTTHALVTDTCASGGGNGNGLWESGETVQFSITVNNDGNSTLTGVSAAITSPTAGVVILDGAATYPNLPPATSAASNAPHFTARIPAAAACGSSVQFDVQVTTDQGSWSGSFTHQVGQPVPGNATVLNESFSGGIPGTWTVVNGGTGGGAAATWTTANPGNRTFTAPLAAPVAIVDSDNAASSATQDEQLITAVLNLSTAQSVTLQFDQYFRWFSSGQNEFGDVDVRSSLTAGAWVNVFRNQGASTSVNDHRSLNISPQAAGAADVQIRFHYYQASFEWWWQIDNVKVDVVLVPTCTNSVCAASGTAKPVAGMTASRSGASSIDVAWDVVTCTSTDHEILYGDLATVGSYALGGSVCGIGASGSTTWPGVPAGDLWFVVTGIDGSGTEATWGKNSAGADRGGSSPSGYCGNSVRNNGASCP